MPALKCHKSRRIRARGVRRGTSHCVRARRISTILDVRPRLKAMRALRACVCLGSATALAGCVLFASFNDLTGGLPEGGGTSDAPLDQVSPSDAGGLSCVNDGGHDLCDNFDDTNLGDKWSALSNTGGTLALDDAAAISPPRSLLATSNAGVMPDLRLKLQRASLHDLTCEMQVRLDELGPTGNDADLAFFEVFMQPSSNDLSDWFVRILLSTNNWYWNEYGMLVDGGPFSHNDPLPTLDAGTTWRRVRISMDLLGSENGKVTIEFDGTNVYEKPLKPPAKGSMTLDVGAHAMVSMKVASKVRIDDVWCDFDRR
jgi:hypothetical protein